MVILAFSNAYKHVNRNLATKDLCHLSKFWVLQGLYVTKS